MINVSNGLSVTRIILSPIIFYLTLLGRFYIFPALIIFIAASITDYFDGYFARKHKTVSSTGAFLDPLADKFLVLVTLLGFYFVQEISLWVFLVIASRDIIVTGMRILANNNGKEIITENVAKLKTTLQFILAYMIFANLILKYLHEFTKIRPLEIFMSFSNHL